MPRFQDPYELVRAMKEGDLDPREHLEEKIRVIEEKEPEINAFITLELEGARKRAEEIKEVSKDERGRLYGLVLGIKDNFALKGLPMTCGSKILENYHPPYTATPVERIIGAHGVVVGKNNMDEFACGSSGETSAFGPTKNPWNPEYVPGGSSSGSAAAVASGMVDLALGSDTGGSIRQPASFTGIYGFKPTYGLVSRYGLADLAMSLDVPGPLAPTLSGIRLMMEVIAGRDPRDPTTKGSFVYERPEEAKVAVVDSLIEECDPVVKSATKRFVRWLEKDHSVEHIELPLADAFPAYYLVMYPEFASAMQRFDGLKYGYRGEDADLVETVMRNRSVLGKEVKRRILLGTYVSMAEYRGKWYSLGHAARNAVRKILLEALKDHDFLVFPTSPTPPFKLGERINDPVKMYMADMLTVPANLAGLPALSVPVSRDPPVGVQILGRPYEDGRVVGLAEGWE